MNSESRTRKCAHCTTQFSYPVGRGRDRRHCSGFCRAAARRARKAAAINGGAWPTCVVDGCSKSADGPFSKWCKACREQMRRTGGFARKPHKGRVVTSHGYCTVVSIGHPLANKHGRIYEHRKVLFDAIGDGEHVCHWCSRAIRWMKGACTTGALLPDHLDGNKQNNALSNLVPSCHQCNSARGLFMSWVRAHVDDPLLWQMYESARKAVAS